jgi:hypothetical protein
MSCTCATAAVHVLSSSVRARAARMGFGGRDEGVGGKGVGGKGAAPSVSGVYEFYIFLFVHRAQTSKQLS